MPFFEPEMIMPRTNFGAASIIISVYGCPMAGKSFSMCSLHVELSLPPVRLKENETTAGLPAASAGRVRCLPESVSPEISGRVSPGWKGVWAIALTQRNSPNSGGSNMDRRDVTLFRFFRIFGEGV